jgi:hypothetical protein
MLEKPNSASLMILPPDQRGNLTNAQWQRLKPLLPAQKPSVGRPE